MVWLGGFMTWSEMQQTSLLATPNGVQRVSDVFIALSLLISHVGRALKATISPKDHEMITALQGDFGKLKADFDRAVDVAVLTLVRRTGKHRHYFGMIYTTNVSN
jgi:hypothetical protein